MSDPTGSYSFTYDQWGNRVSDAKTVLGVNYVIAYAYDSDNRLTSLTYPSGRVVQYVRDAAGRVTSVLTDNGNTVVAQNLAYLPFGPFTSAALGNGLSVSRSFDQNYWLSAMSVGGAQDLSYTRNALGHITAITDNLVPGQSQTFTYDDIYRLAAATGGYGILGYSYDANGNRLTQTVNGQTDTYAYVTGSNRLQAITRVNPESFTHDAVGNVASRNNLTLAYDQNQRMVQAVVGGLNTTNYGINGLGQRVIKDNAAGVVVYHFDKEGRLLAETSSAGATVKEYIWLEGRLLAVVDSSGLVFAAVSHRGEPTAMTNASGTAVWTASAQPFGATVVNEDPDNDGVLYHLNLRLPGQYFTEETGLHYNYFRFYASDLGRYLQGDPIGLVGGTSLYVYVQNDPMNGTDPWGLKVINNSGKSIYVKSEAGDWFTILPGQTYPGSPDGVIGPNGQLAVWGKWWLPDNDVTVGEDGVPVCSGGLCNWIPEKPWPDTKDHDDWIPPENPPVYTGNDCK